MAPRAKEVKFSNLDKTFFPETGFTKGDLIRYYVDVAPFILPHLKNRPVTLIRFPDGFGGGSFYEKNAPKFTPEWVKRAKVPRRRHEGEIDYVLINDEQTLAWCANLAAIELHPFLHRAPKLETPTHVAFDLDPGEGADVLTCAQVAFLLKGIFDGLGLEAFPKVSGSKGIQIYVPLNTPVTYEMTSPFAETVAQMLEQDHPDLVVSKMAKLLRKKKVLIDWSQNSASKTTVSVYSVRAKRSEPYVSMPVTWDELRAAIKAKKPEKLFFTPDAALKRLKKLGDLFEPVLTLKQKLPKAFASAAKKKTSTGKAAKSAKPEKALEAYSKKRDFTKTAEPGPKARGKKGKGADGNRFVIQKHAASHLHYDFRLEMDGTLKSWAVPKGLPYETGVKRSAFQVEDHPLDYMKFEGTIPKGQYGGGTVMVWDIGTYELLPGTEPEKNLKLRLAGRKLKGEWHMFRIKSDDAKPVWLIAKSGEEMKPLTKRQEDSSVLTRRSMARIAKDNDAEWQSNR